MAMRAHLLAMSDSKPPASSDEPDTQSAEPNSRAASQDLADGLELMLRAARKVVKKVDPAKIESAGRRAMDNLESLDAKKVGDFGKKAAKNLDPKKIEEVAGDAGRELLSVIERVADRMEKIVDRAMTEDEGSDKASGDAKADAKSEPPPAESKAPSGGAGSSSPPPRVRVDDA